MKDSQDDLLEGIIADARAEAARLARETEKTAAERRALVERQIEAIKREAENKAKTEEQKIKIDTERALSDLRRRAKLRRQGEVVELVLDAVRKRVAGMISSAEYANVLLGWITEATMGLSVPQAKINTSAAEAALIDGDLLRAAEEQVKSLTGSTVTLTKARGESLHAQGVFVTSGDGRVAFNNQVEARLMRGRSAIRRLIYEKMLGEE